MKYTPNNPPKIGDIVRRIGVDLASPDDVYEIISAPSYALWTVRIMGPKGDQTIPIEEIRKIVEEITP
jgi:hypothetical protein